MNAGALARQQVELQFSIKLQCEGNVTSLWICGVVVLGGSTGHCMRVCVSVCVSLEERGEINLSIGIYHLLCLTHLFFSFLCASCDCNGLGLLVRCACFTDGEFLEHSSREYMCVCMRAGRPWTLLPVFFPKWKTGYMCCFNICFSPFWSVTLCCDPAL